MNKSRRTELNSIISELEALKYRVDTVMSEEQDCFDNMPENLQGSSKGEAMETAVDYMDEAINAIDEAICNLNDSQFC